MATLIGDCYDHPRWFDLAFADETLREADFIEAACRKYAIGPCKRLFEPGCGGGRLIVELARRGYRMTGFDLNPHAVAYARSRLKHAKLRGTIFQGDMRSFQLDTPADGGFNTFNTFRHLLTEADARSHLQCVADALRPGGIYILGFHLLPLDVSEESHELWTVRKGQTTVNASLRVLSANRKKRIETLRLNLRVRTGTREFRLRSEFAFRMYTAAQFRRLLASVPAFEICDVFDFWYEIDKPLKLDDRITDAVLVLRKTGGSSNHR